MSAYTRILDYLTKHQISVVALDTPVFQGFQSNEEDDPYNVLFTLLEEGKITAIASPLTLQTGLSAIHKACGEREVVEWKNAILRYPNLSFKPINTNTATVAGAFQAEYGFKLSLAALMALAQVHEAQVVLTKLNGKQYENLPIPLLDVERLAQIEEELPHDSAV